MTLHLKRSVAMLVLLGALGFASPAMANKDTPFSISVDGEKLDASAPIAVDAPVDAPIPGDVDIQVKFDGLGVKPQLNVSTFPIQVNFRSGEKLRFLATCNYAAWIKRAEVRVFDRTAGGSITPIAVLPIEPLGGAEWLMPENAPQEMDYVLRVYDEHGRFDETKALPLKHSATALPLHPGADEAVAPGYGEDRAAIRNIQVFGGAVTVYGKNIPKGHDVRVMGEPVPVDGSDGFVTQRLLPPGQHSVAISVLQDGKGLNFTRDIVVPANEWFSVGLADLTIGHNFGNGIVEHTGVDEYPGTWTRGHAAFYLKGKIKGKYILTAAADTGEDTLQNMFSGMAGKDPRAMLKRISPNDYYPVYGDDSTAIDDAPTSGKVYVRLEQGPSSVTWGNFKSNITGTRFLASQRALYGASGVYRSESTTQDGEAKRAVDAYAAQPGTVPNTEVFRGTGGSAYFLIHQDITIGSEIISVEARNPVTGFVASTTQLQPGADYRFDPVNGILILNAPLPSDSGGKQNFLIVHYAYQPIASDGDAYAYGGRAETWLGNHLRLGVSALREKVQTADQTAGSADLRLQTSKETYIELEVAHSEGPGFGSAYSVDGGLTSQTSAGAGTSGIPANAWRVESGASLDEATHGRVQGSLHGAYEHDDAGFSTPQMNATTEKTKWGVSGDAKLPGDSQAKGEFSENNALGQSLTRSGKGSVLVPVGRGWSVEPYGKYTEQTGTSVASTQNGARGDAGARLIHDFDKDHQVYVFGQGTFALRGSMLDDNRGGIGALAKITDRITASGEISGGNQGPDATASLNYAPTADDSYSLGYRRDAFRSSSPGQPYSLSGDDYGTVTLGAHHRFNEQWSAFNENNFDLFGNRRAITNAYGISYTPAPAWSIDIAAQTGRVFDNTLNSTTLLKNPDIYRDAGSLGVSYHDKNGLDGKAKGEVRWDYADDGSSEIMSYLLQLGVGAKMSEDWRALANLDVVISDASADTKSSAYINGVGGIAYRPAKNDRVNALVKYNYVYDNPGDGQSTSDGTTTSPSQISHIVSGDVTYNVTEKLGIGGKYGVRLGKIKDRISSATWTDSAAHLGIVRLDYHIVKEWDAMLEGRVLWSPTNESKDFGMVAAVYRQFGENFKFGVGYNFGDFSDDLSHIAHDNHGVFVNLIGKF
ncbi:autotransporter outer membrane beta-barrel domain-containing protein [Aestuariivirga litoralis]|uniref:autotransporter outer membrane beta-barrel domain-containing protein n=1 Tax=Aestuariivirga litoralis TaxID=2650924 RepID=UPI0018C57645|nr:autotransporter outer membrane beta-barrel domain-containing protein [Aestuariivirga litoralis]MBG1233474.1 autotransporter outer membrane beta-barrel domain-containing protein [Aestuariivirga litoralis]